MRGLLWRETRLCGVRADLQQLLVVSSYVVGVCCEEVKAVWKETFKEDGVFCDAVGEV